MRRFYVITTGKVTGRSKFAYPKERAVAIAMAAFKIADPDVNFHLEEVK